MRTLLFAAIFAFTGFGIGGVSVHAGSIAGYEPATFEHGGGCRKSSPPGQCCHMDNSTGTVHCH